MGVSRLSIEEVAVGLAAYRGITARGVTVYPCPALVLSPRPFEVLFHKRYHLREL